jgi:cytochrome c peroxidase
MTHIAPGRASLILAVVLAASAFACSESTAPAENGAVALQPLERLGQLIFEDTNLSIGKNQSCATCHAAEWGFKGSGAPQRGGVFEGSIAGRFGDRATLSAAYAPLAPVFHFSAGAGGFVGGNFWDGRATGQELGDPAAEQARGPFLNPVEQGLPDAACVVLRVGASEYGGLYREVWGGDIDVIEFPADADALCGIDGTALSLSSADRDRARLEYDRIARAISAFEASPAVSAFSSKFDAWLRGEAAFTRQEMMGLMLFQGPARCDVCHTLGGQNLLTDFGYHNLGTPANPENPAQQADPAFVDLGLGGPGGGAPGTEQWGLMRTPTLRNVDRRPSASAVKPFMHNGVFLSLEEVVRFYNTRDVLPECGASAARSDWGVTGSRAPWISTAGPTGTSSPSAGRSTSTWGRRSGTAPTTRSTGLRSPAGWTTGSRSTTRCVDGRSR